MNPLIEKLSAASQFGLLNRIHVDLLLARASDWSHWIQGVKKSWARRLFLDPVKLMVTPDIYDW
jgi:predicted glycosyl hydrolase (DUF1957 family)